MASMIGRVFDVIGEAAIGLVVAVLIVAFGAMMLANFGTQVDTDYGNTSTAAQVIDEGETGLLDFSDNFTLIVLAIVFVVVLGIILLVKRSAEGQ